MNEITVLVATLLSIIVAVPGVALQVVVVEVVVVVVVSRVVVEVV